MDGQVDIRHLNFGVDGILSSAGGVQTPSRLTRMLVFLTTRNADHEDRHTEGCSCGNEVEEVQDGVVTLAWHSTLYAI